MKCATTAVWKQRSVWAFFVVILLTGTLVLTTGVKAESGTTDLLNLDFRDVDIRDVLRAISVQQGVNVVADPDVTGPVTIRLERVTAEEGLRLLAASYGWVVEMQEGLYRLRQTDHGPVAAAVDFDTHTGTITVDSGDQPLGALLRMVAKYSQRSLAFSHGVADRAAETISVYLHDQFPLRAMEIMLRAAGLHMWEDDDTIYVQEEAPGPFASGGTRDTTANPLPAGMGLLRLSDGVLDLELRNVSVGTVLRELVERFEPTDGLVPIFADRDVSDIHITGAVTQVPLIEALAVLISPYGLKLSEAGGGYRIGKVDAALPYTVTYIDDVVAVSAKEASLRDLLRDIAVITGVTIVLPEPLSERISADLHPMPPYSAVSLLLDMVGYGLDRIDHADADLAAPKRDVIDESSVSNRWHGVYRVIPPDTRPLRVQKEGDLFTLEAQNVRLSMVLEELSDVSGKNILLEQGPDPTMTMTLRQLNLSDLLQALLAREGGHIEERAGYLFVRPGGTETNGRTDSAVTDVRNNTALLPDGISRLRIGRDGIDAHFSNVSVGVLFEAVADMGGPHLTADKSIVNDRLSGTVSGKTEDALRTYLIAEGYRTFPLSRTLLVHSGRSNDPIVHMDSDGLFYLDVSGTELTTIIRDMAHKAGRSVILYSHIRGAINHVRLYGVTFEEALQHLLRGTTFAAVEREGTYLIGEGVTPRFDARELFQSETFPLRFVTAQHAISLLPPSLPAQNMRALPDGWGVVVTGSRGLIREFEAFISSVDRPSDIETVLVPLRYTDGAEAAALVGRQFAREVFHYIETHNAFLLQGTPEVNKKIKQYIDALDVPAMATRTVILPLQHMMAEEAKSHLPTTFDSGRILVISDQNALVYTGREEQIRAIRAYLQSIDKRNPQIRFDVMIVEINDRKTTQFGLSGGTEDGNIKFDLPGASPFTWTFGAIQTGGALVSTLSALVQEGQANLLANPRLTTLSGKEASFNVLTTSRFWSPQTSTDPGTGADSTTIPVFRTIETGIRLRLVPWISAAGEITIELTPEISDSDRSTGGGSLPSTNDRSVNTTVRVRDGETFVIGGLIQRSEQNDVAKVPILGDLPILGRLFRSENRGEVETEFVIAITSHLVDFSGHDEEVEDVSYPN